LGSGVAAIEGKVYGGTAAGKIMYYAKPYAI